MNHGKSLVIQSQTLHYTRPEILNKQIAGFDDAQGDFLATRVFQIERDAALGSVES